ncbi:MAG TPA: hypothetical protein VL995_11975 [Cellvibrio sp.]|nr:hypothetical protein [Cellvibrio sp.]
MSILFPILFFGIPLVIALKLCGWQVVISFLVAIFIVPFCVVFFTHLAQVITGKQVFNVKECLEISTMFAIPGVPIYFLIVLPLYYFIQTFNINFYIAFACAVSVVMLVVAKLLENEAQPFWVYLVMAGCSIAHSLLIVWLIAKLKSVSV